ncbi:MAG: glycosyltransferase family 4 protein [Actinobacteria bacterium]|nr:MAG: glycosyltransferase family 4 protein [Actinomycetota bacterium]
MRICIVSQEYPPETARGGIGSQNWTKAHALAGLGHEVHVLSSSTGATDGIATREGDGVTVHRIEPPGVEFPVYEAPAYWVGYTWSVLAALQRLMKSLEFDVIDFAEYGAEGFAYQLDRTPWSFAPVAVQLHGPLSMFAERIGWPEAGSDFERVGTFMEELSIQRADALMACSANIADFTAERHGVARDSIDVVHCGVDSSAFTPPPPGFREAQPPTVLFVGNLAANKGLGTVLDAVLLLRSRWPDLRLRVLGKGEGSFLDDLRARAHSAGTDDALELLGFVQDRAALPDLYRSADVFASPAQHEVGVANVYIEAMACACPVVAAETGAAPEAVADGESGLLVRPGDVRGTAAALERILGDPELARRMGEGGRRRVDEYFSIDRYVERVLGTYERAIARSAAISGAPQAEVVA